MSDLNNELWAVQAGDKLLIMDGSRLSVVTVDRVTPMQVVIQYDAFAVRYRKENGREVGADTYNGEHAYVWETEEPILRGRTPWFVGMVFPEAAEVLQ